MKRVHMHKICPVLPAVLVMQLSLAKFRSNSQPPKLDYFYNLRSTNAQKCMSSNTLHVKPHQNEVLFKNKQPLKQYFHILWKLSFHVDRHG